MEIKITNTYTDTSNGQLEVILGGRTENNEYKEIEVHGIQPHYHVLREVAKERANKLIQQSDIKNIKINADVDGWKGEDLSRIDMAEDCDKWDVINNAKSNFSHDELFQADVSPENQLRVEQELYTGVSSPSSRAHYSELKPVEIKESRTRICYIDIEVDDRGEFVKDGSREIISIVAQDSYTEEVIGFVWTDGREIEDIFPNGRPEKLDKLHYTETEKGMLKKFRQYIEDHNQDMWTGWNFEDFDAPYLINRFDNLNLDQRKLSRNGQCYTNKRNNATVGGRVMYDLQSAWKRTKYKEPDSTALDNVAKKEIDAEKIGHPGMGYHEMWQEDPELLMNYNAQDVILCHELNQELGTISFWGTLRDIVGVDWEETRANSDYIRMFCLRKLDEKNVLGGVTNYSRPESDYEGAFVFDPYYGRAKNVMGLDLASLYPYSMEMGNLSPEKKVTPEQADTLERAGIDVCRAPNGACFRLDEQGIFTELVDDAIGLKSEAKEKRNAATPGTDEHDKLAEEYAAKKTVTNSIYGVTGWEPFFLYDEQVAEATTLLGQAVIKKTAEYIESETDGEVVYGDTDSNYVKFPEELSQQEVVDFAFQLCETLNQEVYPEFAEEFGIPGEMNRWDIEPEVLMDTFFQSGQKKMYAYKAIWEDGHWLDEPDYNVKGFSFKKSSSSQLTREIGYEIIRAILDWKDTDEISKIINDATEKVDPVNPDWELIGIPQGLGNEIHIDCKCDDCYTWSKSGYHPQGAHPRGAYFMNQLVGRDELEQGSKPKRVYLQPTMTVGEGEEAAQVDVIAFEDVDNIPNDILGELMVDSSLMIEKVIEKPFRKMVGAVNVDVDAAIEGQTQSGLDAFI